MSEAFEKWYAEERAFQESYGFEISKAQAQRAWNAALDAVEKQMPRAETTLTQYDFGSGYNCYGAEVAKRLAALRAKE